MTVIVQQKAIRAWASQHHRCLAATHQEECQFTRLQLCIQRGKHASHCIFERHPHTKPLYWRRGEGLPERKEQVVWEEAFSDFKWNLVRQAVKIAVFPCLSKFCFVAGGNLSNSRRDWQPKAFASCRGFPATCTTSLSKQQGELPCRATTQNQIKRNYGRWWKMHSLQKSYSYDIKLRLCSKMDIKKILAPKCASPGCNSFVKAPLWCTPHAGELPFAMCLKQIAHQVGSTTSHKSPCFKQRNPRSVQRNVCGTLFKEQGKSISSAYNVFGVYSKLCGICVRERRSSWIERSM